jgi:chemosensory pili system protein ChpA (sensor histidine kinase/response regulator)
VLHLFEGKRPGDTRPREAIAAARDYAAGRITPAELREKRAAAADAADAASFAAAAAAAAAADADAAAAYAAAAAADAAAADADADAAAAAARATKKAELGAALLEMLTSCDNR